MLQTISWNEFLIITGLGAGVYYGWWTVRYYPGWRRRRQAPPVRDRIPEEGRIKMMVERKAAVMENGITGVPAAADRQVAESVLQELPFPAVIEKTPFPPVIEANLKTLIVKFMETAHAKQYSEQKVLALLRELLSRDPYPRLKGTGFQEKVSGLIVGEMGRYGSIQPDPEVVNGLWTV